MRKDTEGHADKFMIGRAGNRYLFLFFLWLLYQSTRSPKRSYMCRASQFKKHLWQVTLVYCFTPPSWEDWYFSEVGKGISRKIFLMLPRWKPWPYLKAQDFRQKHLFHMKEVLHVYTHMRRSDVWILLMAVISGGFTRNASSEKAKKNRNLLLFLDVLQYICLKCVCFKKFFQLIIPDGKAIFPPSRFTALFSSAYSTQLTQLLAIISL